MADDILKSESELEGSRQALTAHYFHLAFEQGFDVVDGANSDLLMNVKLNVTSYIIPCEHILS